MEKNIDEQININESNLIIYDRIRKKMSIYALIILAFCKVLRIIILIVDYSYFLHRLIRWFLYIMYLIIIAVIILTILIAIGNSKINKLEKRKNANIFLTEDDKREIKIRNLEKRKRVFLWLTIISFSLLAIIFADYSIDDILNSEEYLHGFDVLGYILEVIVIVPFFIVFLIGYFVEASAYSDLVDYQQMYGKNKKIK